MELVIDPENIESCDNTGFGILLSCLVIQRDGENLTKVAPFMLKMSEEKIKSIWKKISRFLTFDDRQWFKSFIKDFLIQF